MFFGMTEAGFDVVLQVLNRRFLKARKMRSDIAVPPKADFRYLMRPILRGGNYVPKSSSSIHREVADSIPFSVSFETFSAGFGKCPKIQHHPTLGDISSPDICCGDVKLIPKYWDIYQPQDTLW